MDRKTFGSLIAELRKEKGMTQAELAEAMGVTDKAVSKWERDLSYPDTASLPRLAEIFGVSVDELMRGASGKAEEKTGEGDVVSIVLKAVPLAMGVAVTVLSVLGRIDTKSAFTMLGIGLACLSVHLLRK